MAHLHAGKATYSTTLRDHILRLCHDFNTPYVVISMEVSLSNFRHKYAVSKDYKGNRDKAKMEKYLPYIRDVFKWSKIYLPAIIHGGIENDDVISLLGNKYGPDSNLVFIANDVDMLAVPGTHYNLRSCLITRVTLPGTIEYKEGKCKATGHYNIWSKIIKGSPKENYPGIKGAGDRKAYELLKNCNTEEDMIQVTTEAFYTTYGIEKGKLLLEEGYSLCNLLRHNPSFVDPPVTDFVQYCNNKLVW